MKKIFTLIAPFIFLSCTGQSCKELPEGFSSYEAATELILNADFKIEQETNVSNSSFIESAEYFSCNGAVGFLLLGMNNEEYLFQNVPYELWNKFKAAHSKGIFYNDYIRGKYRVKLNF